jgi:hypothetical protein
MFGAEEYLPLAQTGMGSVSATKASESSVDEELVHKLLVQSRPI